MLNRPIQALFLAIAGIALQAAPAAATKPVSPPKPPPNGTFIGGCDATLPSPNAIGCAGYYSGNILDGSSTDILNQQKAIATLPGGFAWDGKWTSLESAGDVVTALTAGNKIDFGTMLYGPTIIGAHFGNILDSNGFSGNVSVFWLFDFGTTGQRYIALDNVRGFSNAALYETAAPTGAVPEPGTWAMMLLGFAAIGSVTRYRKRRTGQVVAFAKA